MTFPLLVHPSLGLCPVARPADSNPHSLIHPVRVCTLQDEDQALFLCAILPCYPPVVRAVHIMNLSCQER
jgi:hypothetical protein